MHHGLIKSYRHIVEEARVPKAAIVEEARGLRDGDATRLGDLVVLDFNAPGRHLVLDGVVTTVYRNYILSMVATVPGFAAKQVEYTKFKVDMTSTHPISAAYEGRHTFEPFAMEDGGRIGAQGQAVLGMLAEHAVAKGRLSPVPRNATSPSPRVTVSLWVRK